MPSFQISISPSERAAGRFIYRVRRAIQKALAEEQKKSGLSQSDIARAIGVHRSVINRELRGKKDITLGRVAQLAWAMGRKPVFELATFPLNSTNVPNQVPGAMVSVVTTSSNEIKPAQLQPVKSAA